MQYEQLEISRFIKRHAITQFQFNPNFPVNTLTMMRMAVAAQMAGELRAYVNAGFHHMWEAGQKMDDPEVIRIALTESGLDAERLLAAAQTPEVKQQLMNNTEAAVERGVFGIPSFFVGDELFFGKDRLRDVEEEIAR
jgi:2-hydroxychromene-2-carboxylate isomerase